MSSPPSRKQGLSNVLPLLGNLPYCFVYIDDILVFSPDLSSHIQHLRDVLELCRAHGLTIGLGKCEFAGPVPWDGKLNATRVLAPLTSSLKGPGISLQWSPAFHDAKLLLTSVPVLTHLVHEAAISLAVDASDSYLGAVLLQHLRGAWSPLAFFSKKLSSAESKYSAFNREILAAYSSVRHFRFLLETREFTLFTDHKPLTLALFRSSLPWSAQQQFHLAHISKFTSDIVHIPGSENGVADALSRPTSPSSAPVSDVSVLSAVALDLSTPGFDFSPLPAVQSACPYVQSMISIPSLSVVSVPFLQSSVL